MQPCPAGKLSCIEGPGAVGTCLSGERRKKSQGGGKAPKVPGAGWAQNEQNVKAILLRTVCGGQSHLIIPAAGRAGATNLHLAG